jgi:ubiquinone/menaquinone biosynthesis C-methylase UbiE
MSLRAAGYGPLLPNGNFDTIVCLFVINALSRNNRVKVIAEIQRLLAEKGNAYLSDPLDVPKTGKLGMHHSLQSDVVLTLPGIYRDKNIEVNKLQKDSISKDKTTDFLSLRSTLKMKQ